MSRKPISLSPDLRRLQDEGYDIEAKAGHLIVKDVPYVDGDKKVRRGTLVSTLDLAQDVTTPPSDHVVMFAGEPPCHQDGRPYTELLIGGERKEITKELVVEQRFSHKPASGKYADYYEKMTTYVRILGVPAQAIDPSATAETHPVIVEEQDKSVFHYEDTASSRAGITGISRKLELAKVAILGLGGTGSYVLDQVAKTPVKEIHLFDGDYFKQHNAFRSPGAPSIEQLHGRTKKVAHFHAMYSKMHRHIVPHDYFVDAASNADELKGMAFVFVCFDRSPPKKIIIPKLEEFGVPFVDVGMGLYVQDEELYGHVRVTTSTPNAREHVRAQQRIQFADGDGDDEYATNIQVADLNALNAIFAVIKWKKHFGFYGDQEREHFSTYVLGGNELINEDKS